MLCRDMAVHELCVQGMLDLVQGLDPASRRNLWDVVKAAKLNRGIILTTHSMEEAEVSTAQSGLCAASPPNTNNRTIASRLPAGFYMSAGIAECS